MADEPETPQDEPAPEQPEAEQPAAEEPEAPEAEATDEQPADEAPAEPEAAAAAEQPADEAPAEPEAAEPDTPAEPEAAAEPETPAEKPKRKKDAKASEPDVIPGAHLEPDLVLEEDKREDESGYVGAEVENVDDAPAAAADTDSDEDEAPAPLEAVLNLAADARYRATGKRKSAVARVTLKPGTGEYTINGKSLNEYFPRASLQTKARLPLDTVGQQDRMDVVAKIHGGGVSAQAGALRHGITRALVEADPNLRGELKRRGFLTRDPRVKERKKAGLKKARKRPQFSKR
jgi:small subunit ribosomal protein S9